MLYEICKAEKDKFNNKNKTKVNWKDLTAGRPGALLHSIMKELFEKYELHNVLINERITDAVFIKIRRVSGKISEALKRSGNYPNKLFSSWKNGKLSIWNLRFEPDELSTMALARENLQLLQGKIKLVSDHNDTIAKVARMMVINDKIKEKLEKEQQSHMKTKNRLQKIALKLMKHKKGQDPNSRGAGSKGMMNFSRMHQYRLKKQIANDCQTALSFLGFHDITAQKVEIFNEETEKYEVIDLLENRICAASTLAEERITKVDINNINMLLLIKDKFNISNSAYHEIASACKQLPRGCNLIKQLTQINKQWNIFPTASGNGVQQRITDRLPLRIQALRKLQPENPCHNARKIRVKLTGDGTNIGKRLHVVIIAFTVIDEGVAAMLSEGNHAIAILRTTENYEDLKLELRDIVNEVNTLKNITVDDISYEIEWFLGGDWKFLALVTGIGGAIGTYPCVWCKCPKDKKHDMTLKWSFWNSAHGARSIKETNDLSHRKGTLESKFGCKNRPIFQAIPIDHAIIDTLHLFLRITDNLQTLLILALRVADAIEKKKVFNNGFDNIKYKHMATYEKFLNETCKIDFKWFVSKDTKELKWRDLTGPEKLRLFSHIDIPFLLPQEDDKHIIQQIWVDFFTIYKKITNWQATVEVRDDIRKWMSLFLSVYVTKHITPYMHAFLYHVPEFLEVYGKINLFNQQGLEKLNHDSTKSFFSATNHRSIEAFTQLLQKKNRLEYLKDLRCMRVKAEQRCTNCTEKGHNIKTCLKECTVCKHKPFCAPCHLIKLPETRKWRAICSAE